MECQPKTPQASNNEVRRLLWVVLTESRRVYPKHREKQYFFFCQRWVGRNLQNSCTINSKLHTPHQTALVSFL